MRIAPTTEPNTDALPPRSDAPPSTAAAIAYISYDWPTSGLPEANLEAMSTPARPVNTPASAYTRHFQRCTFTPERRVASSFEPIASA